mmetsp:Transcript_11794/g.11729  ORF Transcript_11794/g.11729 Transcript_11794/m.11729 type:complete len:84 (+) Transcript_11794:213-464(+)
MKELKDHLEDVRVQKKTMEEFCFPHKVSNESCYESEEDLSENRKQDKKKKTDASAKVNFSKLSEGEKLVRLKNMALEIKKLRS